MSRSTAMASLARSPWPMMRRNWRSASSMPAAVQRRHISPDCQCLTFLEERRTHSIIDSHGFVEASVFFRLPRMPRLEEKDADLDRSTYEDYLNLLTNHLLPTFHDRRLSEIDYEAIRAYRTARLREGARRKRASQAGAPLRDRRGRPLRPFGARQVNASIRLVAQILDRAARSSGFRGSRSPDGSAEPSRPPSGCQDSAPVAGAAGAQPSRRWACPACAP